MSALEDERDFLARSLADLDAEREAGDIEADDYDTLKREYAARAEAVQRAIDQHAEEPPPSREPPHRSPSRWRLAAWISGLAAFAVLAGLLVAHGAGQRVAGQTLTGNAAPSAADADLAQASKDLNNGDYLGALKLYDKIVRADPTNAPALAYRGWVLVLSGRAAKDQNILNSGILSLQAAEKADPAFPDSHVFLGMVDLEDRNDPSSAVHEFQTALAGNLPPNFVQLVQGELQVAEGQAASTTTTAKP